MKIVDFNVSKFHDNESQKYTALSNKNYKMWTNTGTLAFCAPEIFADTEYTEAVDMWSSGVVLYTMLCGYQPFYSDDNQDLTEMIQKGKYEFHSDPWDKISSEAKDLISHLLDSDANKRYSPFQVLTHPWIVTTKKLPKVRIARVIENIWKYLKRNNENNIKNYATPKSAMKCNEPRLNIQFSETPKALLSQTKALSKNTRAAYKITSNVSEPCNAKEFAEFQKDLENSKTIFNAFLGKNETQDKHILSLFSKAIDKNHNMIPFDEDCMKNLTALTPNEGPSNHRYDFGMGLLNLEDMLPALGLQKFGSAEPFNLRAKAEVPEVKLNLACVGEHDCN